MIIARYSQSENESRKYELDYSSWLDAGETIISTLATVSPTTSPALSATATLTASATSVSVAVFGGLADIDYTVKVSASTSGAQTKEDCIEFEITGGCF